MQACEVGGVKGTKEVCSEGTCKVGAKGLCQVAGEGGGVTSSTKEVMRRVDIFPGSIGSREEALGSSRARGVLIGEEASCVGKMMLLLVVGGGRAEVFVVGAVEEEAMALK